MVAHEHGRSLVKKLEGRPFVIVGVNSDADRAVVRERSARTGVTWRSFWDGGSTTGPIQRRWNIQAWPTSYLIDHKGIIIGRSDPDDVEKIEKAVAAAEAAGRE